MDILLKYTYTRGMLKAICTRKTPKKELIKAVFRGEPVFPLILLRVLIDRGILMFLWWSKPKRPLSLYASGRTFEAFISVQEACVLWFNLLFI